MICETSWCDCRFQAESVTDFEILQKLHEAILQGEKRYFGIKIDKRRQGLTIHTYN